MGSTARRAGCLGLGNDAPGGPWWQPDGNFPPRPEDVEQVTDQPAPESSRSQPSPAASPQVARCPSCGAVLAQEPGSAAQAIDNLYREVTRLREIAELNEIAGHAEREAQLLEEIRQLRATVARLRATSRVTST